MNPSYRDLLTAVDDLLVFAAGIKPCPIQPTPDPNCPGWESHPAPGAVKITEQDETILNAKEHAVIRLAGELGLSDDVPRGYKGWQSKTGFPTLWNTNTDESAADWRHWMKRLRAMVAELAGNQDAPPDADGPLFGNWFCYAGNRYSVRPTPWKLLKAMWGHDSLHINAVEAEVWGDDLPPAKIGPTLNRANNVLAKAGYPRRLSHRGEAIDWISAKFPN